MQGYWKDGSKFIKNKLHWYVKNNKLERTLSNVAPDRGKMLNTRYYLKNLRVHKLEWLEPRVKSREEKIHESKFRKPTTRDLYSDKELQGFKLDNNPNTNDWVDEFDLEGEHVERWLSNQNSVWDWEDYSDTSFIDDGDVDWDSKYFIEECRTKYYNYRVDDYYEKMVLIY